MKIFALALLLVLSSISALAQQLAAPLTPEQRARLVTLLRTLEPPARRVLGSLSKSNLEVCKVSATGDLNQIVGANCPLQLKFSYLDETEEGERPAGSGDFSLGIQFAQHPAVSPIIQADGRYLFTQRAELELEPVVQVHVIQNVASAGTLHARHAGIVSEVEFSGELTITSNGSDLNIESIEFVGTLNFKDFSADLTVSGNLEGVQSATLNGLDVDPEILKSFNERIQLTKLAMETGGDQPTKIK